MLAIEFFNGDPVNGEILVNCKCLVECDFLPSGELRNRTQFVQLYHSLR